MECPVCNYKNLPPETAVCPICDSDLSSLQLLNKLDFHQSTLEEDLQQKRLEVAKGKRMLRLTLGATLAIAATTLALVIGKPAFVRSRQEAQLPRPDTLLQIVERQRQELLRSQQALAELEAAKKTLRYRVRKGDSYYKIARLFYGDGRKYLRILQNNDLDSNALLLPGDTLTIKMD